MPFGGRLRGSTLSLPDNEYNEKVAAGILWGSICPQSFLPS
jgi:hypothetical protein